MKSTQSDHNMNFDGMESMAPSRSTKFSGNQYSGKQDPNKTINKGRGPVKGNDGTCHHAGFAASTCKPPVSAVPAVPAQGSTRDNINRGAQVRTPGGTRSFEPSATQNYRGNSDKINVGRGPTKGNQC
jgi:hypothetical protein